jgi:signal transduction histidine kinase
LFAMTSGLGILDPRNLQQNALPPPVYIEEVTADGHEIKPAGRVSLPKPTRTLHLAFTALSLVAPRKVRFRYKLEGYDNDWSGPVAVREATYTNLPPGDYDFRVIACNNDGVWNEAGASWAFSIAPAWFQTNWFRIACAGALLTLMWGVYQLRLQQLRRQFNVRVEERVNERTRIARELHDTLLQSLHGLMFEFQAARNMFRKRPKEALQALDGALAGTERAITESQDAIENLRSNATAEDDLSQLIKEAGENLAVSRNADYDSPSFGLTVEGQQRTLTPVIRDEIYGIAREVLRNAFRHAQAHRIEAEILYDENQLRLRVRDDGKGLDPQVLEKGAIPGHWGLPGVRERAQKIGAKLDVWSEAGAGTEVQLAVAASIAYQKTVGRSRFRLFRRTGNHEH